MSTIKRRDLEHSFVKDRTLEWQGRKKAIRDLEDGVWKLKNLVIVSLTAPM